MEAAASMSFPLPGVPAPVPPVIPFENFQRVHAKETRRARRIQAILEKTYHGRVPPNAFLRVDDSSYCRKGYGKKRVVAGYYARHRNAAGEISYRRIQDEFGTLLRDPEEGVGPTEEICQRSEGLWWFAGFAQYEILFDSWYATHVAHAPLDRKDYIDVPPPAPWVSYSCGARDHVIMGASMGPRITILGARRGRADGAPSPTRGPPAVPPTSTSAAS